MHNTAYRPTKKPNNMVHNNFRSLINLDISAIKQIGQELLTSKPWSKPIGPNKTQYQGTPPQRAAKQNARAPKSLVTSISDLQSFLKTL